MSKAKTKFKAPLEKEVLDQIPGQSTDYSKSEPLVANYLANDIEVVVTNQDKAVSVRIKPKINLKKENKSFLSACCVELSDTDNRAGIAQGLHKEIGLISPETDYSFQVPYYGTCYFIITSSYTDINTGEVNTEEQIVRYSVSES